MKSPLSRILLGLTACLFLLLVGSAFWGNKPEKARISPDTFTSYSQAHLLSSALQYQAEVEPPAHDLPGSPAVPPGEGAALAPSG